MQKTILTGNIGYDAEVTTFDNGSKVVSFSVANSKKWTDKAGVKQEKTTWVRCNLWNKENLAQYLKKGVRVYVEGEIEARAYTNKEGQTVATLELNVFQIELQTFPADSNGGNSVNSGNTAVNNTVNSVASTQPQNASTLPQNLSTPPANNKPAHEEEDDLPF